MIPYMVKIVPGIIKPKFSRFPKYPNQKPNPPRITKNGQISRKLISTYPKFWKRNNTPRITKPIPKTKFDDFTILPLDFILQFNIRIIQYNEFKKDRQ